MLFKPWDLQQQEMNFVYKRTKYRNTIAGLLKKNSKNKKQKNYEIMKTKKQK